MLFRHRVDVDFSPVNQAQLFLLTVHAGLMLIHRQRRWPNIQPTLVF